MQRKYNAYIVVVIILIVMSIIIIHIAKTVSTALRDERLSALSYTPYKAPQEYLNLFRDVRKLSIKTTTYSRRRYPESEFVYDNKLYINLYKIGLVKKQKLSSAIVLNSADQSFPEYATYSVTNNIYPFDIYSYLSGTHVFQNYIYLNIFGSHTLETAYNDSTLNIHTDLKNMAMRFHTEEKPDIYVKTVRKELSDGVPTNLIFISRNGSLYMLIMSINYPEVKLATQDILRLIK